MRPHLVVSALVAATLSLSAAVSCSDEARTPQELTREGREAYESTCAACHGLDLRGTDGGPPFLDQIYAPNHHPDEAFVAAVENGVPPHHWNFGPMPAQSHISAEELEAIIAYVRSRQRQAGIPDKSPGSR